MSHDECKAFWGQANASLKEKVLVSPQQSASMAMAVVTASQERRRAEPRPLFGGTAKITRKQLFLEFINLIHTVRQCMPYVSLSTPRLFKSILKIKDKIVSSIFKVRYYLQDGIMHNTG